MNVKSIIAAVGMAVILAAGYHGYQWKRWADAEIAGLKITVAELQQRVPASKDEFNTLIFRANRGELAAQFIEKNVKGAK